MKRVDFDLNKNEIFFVYSINEYDRYPIDSILYLKSYRKISDSEWKLALRKLNNYKLSDMNVHFESIRNIKIIELE